MIIGIEFRWDCRTEPRYHEVLQWRTQQPRHIEELTEDGYRTKLREVWGEWTDVPRFTENIRE